MCVPVGQAERLAVLHDAAVCVFAPSLPQPFENRNKRRTRRWRRRLFYSCSAAAPCFSALCTNQSIRYLRRMHIHTCNIHTHRGRRPGGNVFYPSSVFLLRIVHFPPTAAQKVCTQTHTNCEWAELPRRQLRLGDIESCYEK
jgi:hypothetical protein